MASHELCPDPSRIGYKVDISEAVHQTHTDSSTSTSKLLNNGKRMTPESLLQCCLKSQGYSCPSLNTQLMLSYRGFKIIDPCLQELYKNLHCLYLDCNGISIVENLGELYHLKSLYLQSNCISELKYINENIAQQSQIDPSNSESEQEQCNQLPGLLPSSNPFPFPPTLIVLNLSQNNLNFIPPNCLDNLRNLEQLNLAKNRFMDCKNSLKGLVTLVMQGQSATSSNTNSDSSCCNLLNLDLSCNYIEDDILEFFTASSTKFDSKTGVFQSLDKNKASDDSDSHDPESENSSSKASTTDSPFATLDCLFLLNNPCVRLAKNYRRRLLCILKNLKFLDSKPVDEIERLSVEVWAKQGAEAEQQFRVDYYNRKREEKLEDGRKFRRVQEISNMKLKKQLARKEEEDRMKKEGIENHLAKQKDNENHNDNSSQTQDSSEANQNDNAKAMQALMKAAGLLEDEEEENVGPESANNNGSQNSNHHMKSDGSSNLSTETWSKNGYVQRFKNTSKSSECQNDAVLTKIDTKTNDIRSESGVNAVTQHEQEQKSCLTAELTSENVEKLPHQPPVVTPVTQQTTVINTFSENKGNDKDHDQDYDNQSHVANSESQAPSLTSHQTQNSTQNTITQQSVVALSHESTNADLSLLNNVRNQIHLPSSSSSDAGASLAASSDSPDLITPWYWTKLRDERLDRLAGRFSLNFSKVRDELVKEFNHGVLTSTVSGSSSDSVAQTSDEILSVEMVRQRYKMLIKRSHNRSITASQVSNLEAIGEESEAQVADYNAESVESEGAKWWLRKLKTQNQNQSVIQYDSQDNQHSSRIESIISNRTVEDFSGTSLTNNRYTTSSSKNRSKKPNNKAIANFDNDDIIGDDDDDFNFDEFQNNMPEIQTDSLLDSFAAFANAGSAPSSSQDTSSGSVSKKDTSNSKSTKEEVADKNSEYDFHPHKRLNTAELAGGNGVTIYDKTLESGIPMDIFNNSRTDLGGLEDLD